MDTPITPTPADLAHILDGDIDGGGHRYGANLGKSEFPRGWDEIEIIHAAQEIQRQLIQQGVSPNSGTYIAIVDRVRIRLHIDRDPHTQKLFIATMIPLEGDGVTTWSNGRRKSKPLRDH